MFLELLFFRGYDDSKNSLTNHVTALRLWYGKLIRKQSIHDRFTESAVNFIKTLVKQQLGTQISGQLTNTPHFKRVLIKDSTRFQIPEHLKEEYPGNGGNASKAGVHIQFEYDIPSGEISDLNLTNAKRQDNTDAAETMGAIRKGDLIIRDLGYFSQKVFKHMMVVGAFFLSRVKPKTVFYYYDGTKLDMVEIRKTMEKDQVLQKEIWVTTNKIKKPVRLLIGLLPDDVINTRLAKARKEAKKDGRELSSAYISYASLNLFITNADVESLSILEAFDLYHIRWQIELRFKAWKSHMQLHTVRKMSKHRFECYLYAKLLQALICWEIAHCFSSLTIRSIHKYISINKFYKMFTDQIQAFREMLKSEKRVFKNYLHGLYKTSRSSLLLEKKKGKLSFAEIMSLLSGNQHVND